MCLCRSSVKGQGVAARHVHSKCDYDGRLALDRLTSVLLWILHGKQTTNTCCLDGGRALNLPAAATTSVLV